jgi:hypothetical protein
MAHRTVRCATGQCPVHQGDQLWTAQLWVFGNATSLQFTRLSGVLSGATTTAPTVVCKRWTVCEQCADSSRRSQSSAIRRTRQWTVTVRWPHMSELQRSNPNGWVTWLAHRTVSGGTPDCPGRPSTDSLPNGHFGGWGYKYPQPPPLQGIQVFSHCIQYKSSRLHSKTQIRDQILSKSKFTPNI